MVDDQTPLRHEIFQVAKAQAESQVPADAGHDHLRLEFPFPEQWRPSGLHGATLPDPQTQHFPPPDILTCFLARCSAIIAIAVGATQLRSKMQWYCCRC